MGFRLFAVQYVFFEEFYYGEDAKNRSKQAQ
jgi:hypothetical protein